MIEENKGEGHCFKEFIKLLREKYKSISLEVNYDKNLKRGSC